MTTHLSYSSSVESLTYSDSGAKLRLKVGRIATLLTNTKIELKSLSCNYRKLFINIEEYAPHSRDFVLVGMAPISFWYANRGGRYNLLSVRQQNPHVWASALGCFPGRNYLIEESNFFLLQVHSKSAHAFFIGSSSCRLRNSWLSQLDNSLFGGRGKMVFSFLLGNKGCTSCVRVLNWLVSCKRFKKQKPHSGTLRDISMEIKRFKFMLILLLLVISLHHALGLCPECPKPQRASKRFSYLQILPEFVGQTSW